MNKHLLLGFALLVVPTAMNAQNAIGELYSNAASVRGAVVLSGNGASVMSGSQVAAGQGVALLKLQRGGELRICPKTNLSLSTDAAGKSLVLGMNAGAMELNYTLRTTQDQLITPDFRFQLIGPGTFHIALSVAASGDTCVRSLEGNDASLFVAEMMGPDSYQLTPGRSVLFRDGKIAGATGAPPVCGCPEPKNNEVEVLRAAAPQVPVLSAPAVAPPATMPPPPAPEVASLDVPPKALVPLDTHMEVDSSFVYRGEQTVPDYYASVARISLATNHSTLGLSLLPQVAGPVQVVKTGVPQKKPGVMKRVGRFFGWLFNGK